MIDFIMATPLVIGGIFLTVLYVCLWIYEWRSALISHFTLLFILWFSFALDHFLSKAHAAEVELPIKVKVINLTHETLEDAIAYCDERNIPCPELRAQYAPVSEVEFEPLPQDLNEIEPAGGDDGRQHEAVISNGMVTFTATGVIE